MIFLVLGFRFKKRNLQFVPYFQITIFNISPILSTFQSKIVSFYISKLGPENPNATLHYATTLHQWFTELPRNNKDSYVPGLILNFKVFGYRFNLNWIGCSIHCLCLSVAEINCRYKTKEWKIRFECQLIGKKENKVNKYSKRSRHSSANVMYNMHEQSPEMWDKYEKQNQH
jgi:hypothetical protein